MKVGDQNKALKIIEGKISRIEVRMVIVMFFVCFCEVFQIIEYLCIELGVLIQSTSFFP